MFKTISTGMQEQQTGFEGMIEARWTSFIRHAAGKHENHPNVLFQKCLHDEL